MTSVSAWQRWSFVIACTVCIVGAAIGTEVPGEWQVVALAAAVAVFGLPHGALDPYVAWRLRIWRNVGGLAGFMMGYAALVGGGLALWRLAPGVALAAFITLSAVHFAEDWRDRASTMLRLGAGLAVVTLPALWHPAEVTRIFAVLVPEASAVTVATLLVALAPLGLIALAVGAVTGWRTAPWTSVEYALIAATSAALSPLVFFSLYFCLMHGARHLIEVARGAETSHVLATAGVFTVITIGIAAFVFGVAPDVSVDERLLRIVFVGLAVLTVPHMLLIELAARGAHSLTGPSER